MKNKISLLRSVGLAKGIMERKFGLVSMTHRVARRVGAVLFLAAGLALPAQSTFGPVVVLRTGAGTPLVSATQAMGSFSASGPASFQFAFGFSTDEEPTPSLFLDSITLTLAEANGALTAIYNTTDRNGPFGAPPAPGTIFVSPDSIMRQPENFPDLDPDHAHRFSYLVTAPVPTELLGRELNFYVDLFDNQNGVNSLGWFSITPVPEPTTWALLVTALVFFFAFQWRNE